MCQQAQELPKKLLCRTFIVGCVFSNNPVLACALTGRTILESTQSSWSPAPSNPLSPGSTPEINLCPARLTLRKSRCTTRWLAYVQNNSAARITYNHVLHMFCDLSLIKAYFNDPVSLTTKSSRWLKLSLCCWTGFWCRSPSSRPTGLFLWFTPSTRSSSCVTTRRCSWWIQLLLMSLWLRWTTRGRSPWVWLTFWSYLSLLFLMLTMLQWQWWFIW